MTTKKLQVQHLPSDCPKADLTEEEVQEMIADQEAKWGEERMPEGDYQDPRELK
jgi:hypothetical protein